MERYLFDSRQLICNDCDESIVYKIEEAIKDAAKAQTSITIIGGDNEELILLNYVNSQNNEQHELNSMIRRIIMNICRFDKISINEGNKQIAVFTKKH